MDKHIQAGPARLSHIFFVHVKAVVLFLEVLPCSAMTLTTLHYSPISISFKRICDITNITLLLSCCGNWNTTAFYFYLPSPRIIGLIKI